jgi:hypothetical protein
VAGDKVLVGAKPYTIPCYETGEWFPLYRGCRSKSDSRPTDPETLGQKVRQCSFRFVIKIARVDDKRCNRCDTKKFEKKVDGWQLNC